ncbi:MAG: class I SAM-dependent methyltransferase [Nitrospinae bacterium]|nr:class I SAM-dependent methyltransferase [Nitrospinota bacterium]
MRKVEPAIYDRNYFAETDGAAYFDKNQVAPKFFHAVCLSGVAAGDRVLDLGCGRGDLLAALSPTRAKVVGLDYSQASLAITKKTLSRLDPEKRENIRVIGADATALGLSANRFDFVFMIDIVEHLYPEQLLACFKECRRVLKDEGQLIVHTSPNKLYNDAGYPFWERPINLALNKLFGQNLMTRPARNEMDKKVHVNEQTLWSLKRCLASAGFRAKVWLGSEYVKPVAKETRGMQTLEVARQVLCHGFPLSLFPPLNYLFSNNIWAVATKEN